MILILLKYSIAYSVQYLRYGVRMPAGAEIFLIPQRYHFACLRG